MEDCLSAHSSIISLIKAITTLLKLMQKVSVDWTDEKSGFEEL
jgi:hypothetical protein